MSKHKPIVGGSIYNNTLAEMRARNTEQIALFEKLIDAANNDATKALIQEGIIRCYQDLLAIEKLSNMK